MYKNNIKLKIKKYKQVDNVIALICHERFQSSNIGKGPIFKILRDPKFEVMPVVSFLSLDAFFQLTELKQHSNDSESSGNKSNAALLRTAVLPPGEQMVMPDLPPVDPFSMPGSVELMDDFYAISQFV